MNIFGHGNYFSKSIENPGNRGEDITPSILTTIGTTYPAKYFVYVFCSCHANPIFIDMDPENIFAIVPKECGTMSNTNCLPDELLTMYTVTGADYSLDGVYTCYSKNKGLATSNIFLSLDIPYKQPDPELRPLDEGEFVPEPESGYEYENNDDDDNDESDGETSGDGKTGGGKRKTRKSKRKRKTRKSKRTRKTRKSKRTRKIKSFRIKV